MERAMCIDTLLILVGTISKPGINRLVIPLIILFEQCGLLPGVLRTH